MSSLITINLARDVLLNPHDHYDVNLAGYVIHSAVHEARVIHTHSRADMAVSALDCRDRSYQE